MSLHEQLLKLSAQRKLIRVGVIGAGKFGSMFLSQAALIPGIHVIGIADLNVKQAKSNLLNSHWNEAKFGASSFDEALKHGTTYVCDSYEELVTHPVIDIIVEATGNPIVAADHILAAFNNGKHVVSATVELDSFCGIKLASLAKSAGVIYSMAYGDQPAMTCELVDWARTCGFKVAAAGRGHKWHPDYRFSTPDTVWNHWGLTLEQVEAGRLNPKMFNSFLDGTKPAIESAAIANACGLDVPENGLTYPLGSIDDIPSLMRPRQHGGVLEKSGMVEVINGLRDDGSEYGYNIRMGVFVVVEAETEYQRKCFAEYKVKTDDSGRYMCQYKRWHLIGLELGMSVANVALRGESTGVAREMIGDVVAVSKRDLKAGEILDGEGGYTVAGQLRPASASISGNMLPLGLTGGVKMKRDVAKDKVLLWDDVEVDETITAVKLRRDI
ncbi:MAG: Gfo/Idh/MocA family oxidoreductase [Rhizobiaceae bacterium]|jgi:predicted homoserine dehydrogenase-like protein|nr:Gfo/Idh/MocA family oxidoreductase [Rhizobiaceae bacterium]